MHCTIGIGLLFKIPGLYRADNFIVNGKPGDGTDDFEKIATTAFGACYFAQLIGIVYSHSIWSRNAKQATILCPMVYHLIGALTGITNKGRGLNPKVASKTSVATFHFGLFLACCAYFFVAQNHK